MSSRKNAAGKLFETAHKILRKVEETQMSNILKAADMVTDTLMNDGVLHTFGAGHSELVAEEVYGRAGGLAAVNAISEYSITLNSGITSAMERLEGFSPILLDYHNVSKGDTIILISSSGRNAAAIDAAIEARKRGLKVIAITSLAHSKAVPSRHSSGKRLFEIADLVIDNCVPLGDATLEIKGVPKKMGPMSTIAGAAIIHAITVQAAQNWRRRGVTPPVFISGNVEGAEEHNKKMFEKYRNRIRRY